MFMQYKQILKFYQKWKVNIKAYKCKLVLVNAAPWNVLCDMTVQENHLAVGNKHLA